jgi:hypothetical protein
MSLLQKYRKDETRKTTLEEERKTNKQPPKKEEKPIAPKESIKKIEKRKINRGAGMRSRPVISATVRFELVEALNTLTDEKYLNRSKFIEDALIRTIKTEFPDIASRYGF